MESTVYKTDKWYHCPTCLNYSLTPMECCGEQMVEEIDDEEKPYEPVEDYELQ